MFLSGICPGMQGDRDRYLGEAAEDCAGQSAAISGKKQVDFQKCPAEQFEITDEDIFFFFNPFTEVILRSVIGRIRESRKAALRPARILCYYPSDEFVACLMTEPDLIFEDEIDCRDLFAGNNERERILVFEMDTM